MAYIAEFCFLPRVELVICLKNGKSDKNFRYKKIFFVSFLKKLKTFSKKTIDKYLG